MTNPETIPSAEKQESIDAKKLFETITDREFLTRLAEASNITVNTDHEAGFEIAYDNEKKEIIWGEVVGAEETGTHEYTSIDLSGSMMAEVLRHSLERAGLDYVYMLLGEKKIRPYLGFHMHPSVNRLMPSGPDLNALIAERFDPEYSQDDEQLDLTEAEEWQLRNQHLLEHYPVMAIGSNVSEKALDLILIREKFGNKRRDPQIGDFVYDWLQLEIEKNDFVDNAEFAQTLNRCGVFKVLFLQYKKSGGQLKLATPGLAKKIKEFCSNK